VRLAEVLVRSEEVNNRETRRSRKSGDEMSSSRNDCPMPAASGFHCSAYLHPTLMESCRTAPSYPLAAAARQEVRFAGADTLANRAIPAW
jgi:hypothetical protein